jgi:O-antigen/teichoic acid export membrane protein
MQHFSRVVARNSIFSMGGQLAIKLLSFGFSVLIIRNLAVDHYGQYTTVLSFGAVFVFLADLGLSPYLVREVARWRDEPDGMERANALFGNILRLRMLMALFTALLLIGSAWLIGHPPVMVIAIALGTLGLMMYSVQGASDSVLAGFERLDLSAGAKVAYQLLFVFVGGALLLSNFGYYGLITANLIGIAAMTWICWRGVRRLGVRPGRSTPSIWPGLLKASIPFGAIGFALGLSRNFDSIFLQRSYGDTIAGHYNAACMLVLSLLLLSNVLNTSLYPSMTRQAAQAPHTLPTIYGRALRYLMVIALPLTVGGIVLADQIMPFLFGIKHVPAIPALQVLLLAVPLMFASEFLGYIVLITNHERRAARAVMISSAVNVLLNIPFIWLLGMPGAAVMAVVTEVVLVCQYLWMLHDTMRLLNWKHILLRPLVAVAIMGVVVQLMRGLPLLLNIALGGLAYAMLLVLLGIIGRDELQFIRQLRQPAESSVSP